MICSHCAAAGDLTGVPAPQLEAVRAAAAGLHGRCPGARWCPCQHAVAPVQVLAARRAAQPDNPGRDLAGAGAGAGAVFGRCG